MSDFEQEIHRVLQDFVARISGLAYRSVTDMAESALAGRGARHARRTSTAPFTRRAGRPRGTTKAKRPAFALEALETRFVAFVQANPGLRIEQINRRLDTTTKDLTLPIRKAIARGVIQTEGEKRSTKYFAVKHAVQN